LILTLLFSVFLVAQVIPTVHAQAEPTVIFNVHYPMIVQVGGTFPVTIQVGYSAKFGMVDVGIWDIANGMVIRSLVSNDTLQGPGNSTYTLTIPAPLTPREWRLAAIARAWVQNAWFYDNGGESDFTINVANQAYLTLTGLQLNSTINIDSTSLVAHQSTLNIPLQLGTLHTIQVTNIIQTSSGTRLVFGGWSDGIDSNPRELLVTGNESLSPNYIIQHSLFVDSPIGSATGNGWYQEGDAAQFAVPTTSEQSSSLQGLLIDSCTFAGWTGDSAATNATAAIVMNGPKAVTARWNHESTTLSQIGITTTFAIASLFLTLRAGLLVRKRRGTDVLGKHRFHAVLLLVLIVLALHFWSLPKVFAALPVPAAASIVNIGDASWYYWPQPASDTCILWLGGGLEDPQGGYRINPFQYESFGTIRFLQDLTKYYCVVALQQGSSPLNGFPNRTIYQEYLQGEFTIARQLHEWIRAKGYSHVFLLGYSVGTEAAASIALTDLQTWGSSDGLILITADLPPDVANGGESLRTNLLLLYGHAPNFEPSGEQFYSLAPTQGSNGTALYKEFRLLDSMGHEVWSPLRDNSYNPTALGIVVNFIETSKALQEGQASVSPGAPEQADYSIIGAEVPTRVIWGVPFLATVQLSYSGKTSIRASEITVAAYDSASQRLLSVTGLGSNASVFNARLIIPPVANKSSFTFTVLVLARVGNMWLPASNQFVVTVTASSEPQLLVTGLTPNSTVTFDYAAYMVPGDGRVAFNVSFGTHDLVIPTVVVQPSVRYAFVQWNDGDRSANRTISLEGDQNLTALYNIQYLVQIASPLGAATDTRYVDSNSTIQPSLQPLFEQSDYVFRGWSVNSGVYGLGDPIPVNSPTTIEAIWEQIPPSNISSLSSESWMLASVLLFLVLLYLNLRLGCVRRKVDNGGHSEIGHSKQTCLKAIRDAQAYTDRFRICVDYL
jgi:uncharacterized repeat protein (TIGR02543 family)